MTGCSSALLLSTAAWIATFNILIKYGVARVGSLDFSFRWILLVVAQPVVMLRVVLASATAVLWFRVLSTQKRAVCYPILGSMNLRDAVSSEISWISDHDPRH